MPFYLALLLAPNLEAVLAALLDASTRLNALDCSVLRVLSEFGEDLLAGAAAGLLGAAAGLLGGDLAGAALLSEDLLAGASLLSEDLLDGASLLSEDLAGTALLGEDLAGTALLGDADLLGDDAVGFSIFSTFFLASIFSFKLVKICCISPRHIGQFFF